MTELKAPPLVLPEVDLTDFKFMPLEVARLQQSEWWIVACAEDARRAMAAVNLWARAWHQRPAGSLPNNDAVLSRFAMVDHAVWLEIRDAVMDAWTLCSDGRWYHPVVADKANAAWAEKLAYQERKRLSKEAGQKGGLKRADNLAQASLEARLEGTLEATPQPKGESVSIRGEGKSKGLTDNNISLSSDPEGPEPLDLAVHGDPTGEGYTAEFEDWWALYPRKDGKGAAFRAFRIAKRLVGIARLTEGVRAYAARMHGVEPRFIKQPATWLNQHCWNDEPPEPPQRLRPKIAGYVPMGNGG